MAVTVFVYTIAWNVFLGQDLAGAGTERTVGLAGLAAGLAQTDACCPNRPVVTRLTGAGEDGWDRYRHSRLGSQ